MVTYEISKAEWSCEMKKSSEQNFEEHQHLGWAEEEEPAERLERSHQTGRKKIREELLHGSIGRRESPDWVTNMAERTCCLCLPLQVRKASESPNKPT